MVLLLLLLMKRLLLGVHMLLRGRRGVESGLRLKLRVVYHAGRRGVLHRRGRRSVRVLGVVLLRGVARGRIASRRGIWIIVIAAGRRCGLHRFPRRIRGRSWRLLGLLSGIAGRQ